MIIHIIVLLPILLFALAFIGICLMLPSDYGDKLVTQKDMLWYFLAAVMIVIFSRRSK